MESVVLLACERMLLVVLCPCLRGKSVGLYLDCGTFSSVGQKFKGVDHSTIKTVVEHYMLLYNQHVSQCLSHFLDYFVEHVTLRDKVLLSCLAYCKGFLAHPNFLIRN